MHSPDHPVKMKLIQNVHIIYKQNASNDQKRSHDLKANLKNLDSNCLGILQE